MITSWSFKDNDPPNRLGADRLLCFLVLYRLLLPVPISNSLLRSVTVLASF